MYGLIHKLKKKRKTTNSKALTTKAKDKHTQFGFALYSFYLLRNVLVVKSIEKRTAQFWCLVWLLPC